MPRNATEILEDAHQLLPTELNWLIENLVAVEGGEMDDASLAEWQRAAGEPEPGYHEWFRAGVERDARGHLA